MKKFTAIILAFLLASLALVACGNGSDTSSAADSSAAVSESSAASESGTASSEASAESSADIINLYDELFRGEWIMDGGAGNYNVLFFGSGNACTYVSPDGTAKKYTAVAYEDKIEITDEDYTETLELVEGELVDAAGYRYIKGAELEGVNQDMVGLWTLDAGAGVNKLRVYSNSSWSMESADGEITTGKFTCTDTELDLGDGSVLFFEEGTLEDQAGYKWELEAAIPY